MNKTRWLTVALVVSLGFNILIVGIVIGRVIAGPPGPMPGPIHLGLLMRHAEPETRAKLAPKLRELRSAATPLRREMREAQQSFIRLLAADEIDEAAIAAAQSRLASASAALQAMVHEQMAETLTSLPAAERQQIIERMQRRGERFRNHREERPEPVPHP